jgi:lipopolysaccharide/colanic/teichoic acid biosynthesis glycosyltransferase
MEKLVNDENPSLNRSEIKLAKVKGNWWYFFWKRVFDFFSSLIVIILISWLLLILWIINLFATKGHPIYRDERIGYKGKKIKVYKFRSMYVDANNVDKYFTKEQKEIWLRERKLDKDPRITKFGKFLRKTSLDELPQLFNILFGSMSVIGWRPIAENELNNYFPGEQKILLSGKPGLTGYWQVYGRGESEYSHGERQSIELAYFTKRGLFYDFGLIFKTIPAVLGHKGAK